MTRPLYHARWTALTAVLLALGSCSSGGGSQKAPAPKNGDSEGKDPDTDPQTGLENEGGNGGSTNPEDIVGKDASLLKMKYVVSVTAAGIPACSGEIELRVKADFKPKTGDQSAQPIEGSGIIDCGLAKIDMAEVLGNKQNQPPPPDIKDPVVVKDDVIYLKAMGYGVYDPPRPFFPSFIAGDPANLSKLNIKVDTKLNDTKEKKQGTGTFALRTLGFNAKHKSPEMDFEFTKILDFELVNTGFEGVNKVANFIFERMQFKINLAPLAIPYIYFEGPVSDLLAAGGSEGGEDEGGALGGILGGGGGGSGGAAGGIGSIFSGGSGGSSGGSTGGGGLGGLFGGGNTDSGTGTGEAEGEADGGIGGFFEELTKLIRVKITLDLKEQEGLTKENNEAAGSKGPSIGD